MRALRLTWKNDKYPRWTKRARWYEGAGSIRIWFEDAERACNRFYTSREDAEHDMELFTNGASVLTILEEGKGK